MKKKTRVLYRISSLLLILLMVVSVFCTIPFTAIAAEVTKEEKSYDIAVVFDNSGSMYLDSKTDWARAKYAMEIFASMLDYEKDRLTVFPMWEVTTDGTTPQSDANTESTKPIEIANLSDIEKLSKMYTIKAVGTPFTPVDKAYDFLSNSTKSEKWLIVLTDGEFDGIGKNSVALKQSLSTKATNGVKVQYLGFGSAAALESDVANGFYTPSTGATTLEAKLIEACNTIFQRSVLPADRLNGNTLNLDLSMKKLIVFVQGQGAKINSLSDSAGKAIGGTLENKQRKYSDVKYGAGNYQCETDDTLFGHVVTFDACAKGKYNLDYTGQQDAIQIFYEPDVDIDISFTNSDGQKIEKPEDFVAGEYTVNSKIVDTSTNEDVTSHELMGKDVKLSTFVKTSKDSESKEYANGSKITFEPDDNTEIWVEGEYLGKYKISSKDDQKWDWLNPIKIPQDTVAFKIDATVLQSQSWFETKDHDNWKPIRIAMTLEGQSLTDEQLANVKLSITTSEDLKYRCEPIQGESAYNVYIAQDENGKYIEPETGKYRMKVKATYTDEYGSETKSNEDPVSFEIQEYDKIWKTLKTICSFLALIALLLWWRYHKSFPKRMTLHERLAVGYSPTGIYQDVRKSFILRNEKGQAILYGRAKKNSAHYKRKKESANIKLKVNCFGPEIKEVRIAGIRVNLKDSEEMIVSGGDIVTYMTSAGNEKRYRVEINKD